MIHAFQPTDKPPAARPLPSSPTDTSLDRPLRCAACRAEITSEDARIGVDGAHAHHFTNPVGFTYDVVCFSRAPGCYLQGDPTTEFTWFRGFAWSFAHCSTCHRHLGWYYQGPSKFFGLIADQLV